ncbi:hypothetical protein L2750_01410 [Shewanella submarina]|uniref:Porin domain-containing protein n=1 Tax=Shewanella submarina TaxID=2016376 RepID=A0ABV7GFL7_9GAMM|nr:hypothetical protein [Shewanella submarina]MCL1035816.1 hypothetical protein [Shewanella submarina]
MSRYMLLCLSLLLPWSEVALAEPDVQFSGFGNIGVIHNDSRVLGFHRDYTMEASGHGWSANVDSMMGLQLNARFNEHFDAMVQVLLKDRVSDDLEDALEWAFVRYQPNEQWSFRAGRLGLDLYMLSEYKDVSYAYLWARPVPEFYSVISSTTRYNGLDITYSRHLKDYMLEARLAYGNNNEELAGADQTVNIELDAITSLTLSLSSHDWLWRLAFARSDISGNNPEADALLSVIESVPVTLWPASRSIAADIRYQNRISEYYAAGARYDSGNWLIQSELGYTDTNWQPLQPYISGYISVGRRVEDFTFYGVYAGVRHTEKIPEVEPPLILPFLPPEQQMQLSALHQGAELAYRSSRQQQHTISVGIRWDFAEDFALKLQWDHVNIGHQGSGLWVRKEPEAQDERVQLFSINLSFIF